jgi:hypothetical protein
MFPIRNGLKQGGALSPLFFKVAVQTAITRVQVNEEGLKLNSAHQLLVYVDDINILGRSVHTTKTNVIALVVVSKENGLEEIADKTKYVVMFRDQDERRSHSVNVDNNSFERAEEFK